jgi:hypothetical protein
MAPNIEDSIKNQQLNVQLDRFQPVVEAIKHLKVPCVSITNQIKRLANVRCSVDLQRRFTNSPFDLINECKYNPAR